MDVGHDTPDKQGDNCLQPASENYQQILFSLKATFGGFVWKFRLEISFGNFVWKFCLEILFETSVWKFLLEISFGNSVCKPFQLWDNDTLTSACLSFADNFTDLL